MNLNQKLFVRITHNGTPTQLVEVQSFHQAMVTMIESFQEHQGRKVLMCVEISQHPFLHGKSLLTREQQLEQDTLEMMMTDESEIMFPPDITLGECNLAFASEAGQLMFKYQRAENRIGMDPDALAKIKSDYESEFPRVAEHAPKWMTN